MLGFLLIPTVVIQHVVWAPSAAIAKAYAVKTGKPLMVITPPPLGRNVIDRCLEDPRVIKLSKRFVCYRASREDLSFLGPIPSNLAPSTGPVPVFFLEASGKLISRMGGFYWPSCFSEYQADALWIRSQSPILKKQVSIQKPLAGQLANWAFVKASQGDLTSAAEFSQRAGTQGATPSQLCRVFVAIGDQLRVENRFVQALAVYKRGIACASNPKEVFKARSRLSSTYLRAEMIDEGEKEALRCLKMAGISKDDRSIAEFLVDRVDVLRRPSISVSK